jgi:hypothetical protein
MLTTHHTILQDRKDRMHKDDWAILLAVICCVTGAVGTFFTMSIALGFNRHMGRWIAERFGGYAPDYGEPCPVPAANGRRGLVRYSYKSDL